MPSANSVSSPPTQSAMDIYSSIIEDARAAQAAAAHSTPGAKAAELPEGMAKKLVGSDVEPPKDWSQYSFPQFLKENLATLGVDRPTMVQAELMAILGRADFDSFITTELEGEISLGICLSVITKAYRRFAKKNRCLDEVETLDQPTFSDGDARSDASSNADDTYTILPSSIVLCPTKEAAEKTHRMLQTLTHKGQLYIGTILEDKQGDEAVMQLDDGCDIIVATPGELISVVENGHLKIKCQGVFIMDETHWLLGSSFDEQLEKLAGLGNGGIEDEIGPEWQ